MRIDAVMKRIQLLDYGRFLAAISVMAFHYFYSGIHNGKITSVTYIPQLVAVAKYGYLGLEFFFMISGYVIFFSAKNRSASQFAVSRVRRLYPAFWAAVIFTSVFAVFLGGDKMAVTPSMVFANFTMVPHFFGEGYVDGVYWTLGYELSFYFLVFCMLLCGLRKKLEFLFLLWPIAIAVAVMFGRYYWPYLGNHYCFFSAGVILAMLKNRKTIINYLILILISYLCVMSASSKAPELSEQSGMLYSGFTIGFVIILFFLFFIAVNSKKGSSLSLYGSRLLGGVTYPIYLVHAHFGYMLISRFATDSNRIVVYPLVFACVLLVAVSIHFFVELRYSTFWESFFSCVVGRPISFLESNFVEVTHFFRKKVLKT